MKKPGFKERFRYWFDNRMAKGSVSMIKMLCLATIIVVVVIAGLILLLGLADDAFSAFWDSLATTINAWMPYSDDGDVGYVILTAVAAIAGLLVTSVLIGIVGSAIEEKITELRKGSSRVLEEGHTVVLGFTEGEYTLISQLVLAAAEEKATVVVAGAGEKDEMEDAIRDNVEIPKNVRVICRSADVTDPVALDCCAIDTAKTVVVAPAEDGQTVKTVLAVKELLKDAGENRPQLVAAVSRDEYLLPAGLCRDNRIFMLQANDVIARIIAHSCTQPGLSRAVTDIFDYEGSEFYLEPLTEAEGLSFADITARLEGGVPLGFETETGLVLRPDAAAVLEPGKRLLFFAEERDTVKLTAGESVRLPKAENAAPSAAENGLLVLGYNEVFDTVVRELPENVRKITLAGVKEEAAAEARKAAEERKELTLEVCGLDLTEAGALEQLAVKTEHAVLLSDHSLPEDEADVTTMLRLMQLRDIKIRRKLSFTVTAEMRREANRKLVAEEDLTDFVVASDMTSMVLAQLAENPALGPVFRELLSNEGNELYLKPAAHLGAAGEHSVRQLRLKALACGYLLLGVLHGDSAEAELNPALDAKLTLNENDSLVVIGEV